MLGSAHTTGAGAGPLGENIHQDQSRAAALGSTAGAATAGAGAHSTQSGVGPAGGAGGHYSADQSHSHSGAGAGATGLGAAGVGAGAAGLAGSNEPASNSPLVNDGQAKGHYGHADQDDSRGRESSSYAVILVLTFLNQTPSQTPRTSTLEDLTHWCSRSRLVNTSTDTSSTERSKIAETGSIFIIMQNSDSVVLSPPRW